MKHNWAGLRVLIIGAARQGLALARYLAAQNARVTINDQRPESQLRGAMEALKAYPGGDQVRWETGGHPLSLLEDSDLVCISGGVPLTLPLVAEATRRGLPLTNDSQVFFEAVRAPVIGITGSAGKTTTTTLVGRMAQHVAEANGKKAWVGGNIGLPLIEFVDQIAADDLVVVELSSFQLEQMTHSPQVGVVLNITPNHLDRHGTLDAYSAAKAHILAYQTAADTAVLNREDPGAWGLKDIVKGSLMTFGLAHPAPGLAGVYVDADKIWYTDGREEICLMSRDQVRLRGEHNLRNTLAACAVAAAAKWPTEAMRAGVEGFAGVAHRLEFVGERGGGSWYNDSIATAPERTIAAIQAFTEPLVLLLGGRDKNLPWERLAGLIHQRVDHVIIFGEAAEKIRSAIGPLQPGSRLETIDHVPDLHSAIRAAAAVVQPGDVVLLSPGGTSFDEFKDFEERGERFREWVRILS